jgi:anaerobic selenocysteine-containing dehydrogenase
VCGIDAGQVTALAELIAERAPLGIKLGQGMQRHANGGQAARVISCLPALLGAYDRPGGGLVYSTGPLYRYNTELAADHDKAADPDKAAGPEKVADMPPTGRRSLAMTNLAANLDPDGPLDPGIEALFIYGANPVVSNPDLAGVRAGLSRPDLFTVVVDVYPTETVDYADIVLPSTMQHEQWELNDSFSHTYVNLNRPAVAPPGQCLPHTELFRRLAVAMGLDEPSLQASDVELIDALLDTPDFAAAGIDRRSLLETGWARLPGTGPYRPFADRFPTPSGRFEFVSQRAETDGHGLIPHYNPPTEAASEGFGYDLVAAAGDWHINSVFAGTARTRSRTGPPPLAVHPDDAKRDGLVDGDPVTVANERGSFQALLAVDDTVRPGTAVTTKGWWGMGVNNTVAERDADMGRGAVYHDNRVSVTASGSTTI